MLRILVAAHSDPRFAKGGAEIAAFQLFTKLSAQPGCSAWFLGCRTDIAQERSGIGITQPFSDKEFIYTVGQFNWFNFANRDARYLDDLERILDEIAPDIIHLHHYANLGVETLVSIRRRLPEVRIVLTLHEFLAICNHFGQMITKDDNSLCYSESAIKCQKCFPELTTSDFFLRKSYIQRFLADVDRFIAPSKFLAERYTAWGIPPGKIEVIENVIRDAEPEVQRPAASSSKTLRVGFFGQISYLKGINVLFDAAALLEDLEVRNVSFEIYGEYRGQPEAFQEDFVKRVSTAGKNVRFCGPYDQDRVDRLMRTVDVIVVPSIWWENSPVVIQEAFRNRKPVICSDIGGMAEKVRDGIDGFHFPVGNPVALSDLIIWLAENRIELEKVSRSIQVPPSSDLVVAQHLALYRGLTVAGSVGP